MRWTPYNRGMNYEIQSLELEAFRHLCGLDEQSLARSGVQRATATESPGYPCRVTLEDAQMGESVLLLNYQHQPAATPYQSAHAIFVRENARASARFSDEIPDVLRIRKLSVRAFDASGMMVDADTCHGTDLEALIRRLFGNASADYLHVHNAARGCYLARVNRA